MDSKKATIFVFLILLGLGSLGIYLFVRLRFDSNQPEYDQDIERSANSVGVSVEKPPIKEVVWKSEDSYISVGAGGVSYVVKLVTEGEVLRDSFEIKTKEGEVLATAVVSVRGFYLDSEGKLQSVIFPQLIKFNDDRLYLIRQRKTVDWSEADIEEIIAKTPERFSIQEKGYIAYAVLTPDVQLQFDKYAIDYPEREIPEAPKYYLSLVNKYNQSWESELERFYERGVFTLDILFPSGVAIGYPEVVDLDSLGK